jgi:small subunit ribosomal protein S20
LGGEIVPNIKSAVKRVNVIRKKTLRNTGLKSALKTSIKKFDESLADSNHDSAKAKLVQALISIDKAVTKGILHKNTAARKKSRLTLRLNKKVQS